MNVVNNFYITVYSLSKFIKFNIFIINLVYKYIMCFNSFSMKNFPKNKKLYAYVHKVIEKSLPASSILVVTENTLKPGDVANSYTAASLKVGRSVPRVNLPVGYGFNETEELHNIPLPRINVHLSRDIWNTNRNDANLMKYRTYLLDLKKEIVEKLEQTKKKKAEITGRPGDKIIDDARLLSNLIHNYESFSKALSDILSYYDRNPDILYIKNSEVYTLPGEFEFEKDVLELRHSVRKSTVKLYNFLTELFTDHINSYYDRLKQANKKRNEFAKQGSSSELSLMSPELISPEREEIPFTKLSDTDYGEYFDFKNGRAVFSPDPYLYEEQIHKIYEYITQVLNLEDRDEIIQFLQTDPELKLPKDAVMKIIDLTRGRSITSQIKKEEEPVLIEPEKEIKPGLPAGKKKLSGTFSYKPTSGNVSEREEEKPSQVEIKPEKKKLSASFKYKK